mmetsp:Transcript_23800/g.29632  ORF Transcript_23800/g.29632 Transcript_23800/m.29632 type:complete len:205 (+) Transcript_23800:564-1178(+)|eukprot:scaffold55338_cov32-Tisochrysis_lutea.AAC.4
MHSLGASSSCVKSDNVRILGGTPLVSALLPHSTWIVGWDVLARHLRACTLILAGGLLFVMTVKGDRCGNPLPTRADSSRLFPSTQKEKAESDEAWGVCELAVNVIPPGRAWCIVSTMSVRVQRAQCHVYAILAISALSHYVHASSSPHSCFNLGNVRMQYVARTRLPTILRVGGNALDSCLLCRPKKGGKIKPCLMFGAWPSAL